MKFDYVIVGAGPAGCIMAERLSTEKKARVLIIEKRDHIGGNLYDYYNDEGILIHKYGPHFFFFFKSEVWEYLNKFTTWHYYEHKVMANVKGQLVPFPINLDTYNTLYNTNLNQVEFEKKLTEFKFTDEPKNAEEAIINQVGQYLYETFFLQYTLKQWGKHPRELHADTVKRVPVRIDRENRYQLAKYQGLPKKGYTHMMKNMISNPLISVMLNTDYKTVISDLSYKKLIYTGPLDYFYDYRFGKLEYRSLRFEEQTHNQDEYQAHAVINYPNNYDFTRITEYKKMTGQMSPKTTIHIEFPEAYTENINDPYYPILDKINTELKEKYSQLAAQEKDVIFLGRLAEYRYYAMDDVVEAALHAYSKMGSSK
ncbi:MAG: UDP-galactopyranose mutase [Bdellovibrionales bacterium]|nr:UDP-galactopyranose mutase [Bdellovibrionales bacterium]